jgi:signal transduction histidine kinase
VRELISELAHELKTPIAVIAGYAELIGARDDERTRVDASVQIQAATERLSRAVDALLEDVQRDSDLAAALLTSRVRREPET